MSSALLEPCGKRVGGVKTSQHDVMDRFDNQNVTARFDVPSDCCTPGTLSA